MKIAIMQPYLLPYLGYFQLINSVDKFIFLDDVNFIKSGWINRNKIMVNNEEKYITIPLNKQSQNRLICEHTFYWQGGWVTKFLQTLYYGYHGSPYYDEVLSVVEHLFCFGYGNGNISKFAYECIKTITSHMNLDINFDWSSNYDNKNKKGKDRLIDICEKNKATMYINAIGGKELYTQENFNPIDLRFIKRLDNENNLSIIDILMRNGFDKTKLLMNKYEVIK